MPVETSRERVLYLGDGNRNGAASYLAGVLSRAGILFDHVPSAERFPEDAFDRDLGAVVFSDYPSRNIDSPQMDAICRAVSDGLGLLMIGGWASFVGRDGGYEHSPLAALLPVILSSSDDRCNTWRPCIVEPGEAHIHEITEALPLDRDFPCVTGFNAFEVKPGADVVLRVRRFRIFHDGDEKSFDFVDVHPLLVLGTHGRGRVACFASDVAPHWAGGLVDWGVPRINAQAEGFNPIEVGCFYAELFERMVRWVRGF
jgi:hypothetical protein